MFTVRPFENRTLGWWSSERENIDFNPPYQRSGRIWSEDDQALLIDSIINEFDIPKIYIADFSYIASELNEKHKPFAVIDGKQRFEAMFNFLDGKLALAVDMVYLKDPSIKLGGLSYRDLVSQYPKVARVFDNFNLSVMSVITDDESKINELFVRLNRSKPLTGAELRNAMRGDVPKEIRELSQHEFFKRKIKFGTKRAQDQNAAAKLLLTEFRGRFVETKKKQLDQLVEDGVLSESKTYKRASRRVRKLLDAMVQIFMDRDPLLKSQGPVLLYYWLVRESPKFHPRIREFLVEFEGQRRQAASEPPSGGPRHDKEMLHYNVLQRSINNLASQIGCFAILHKRFRAFIGQ